MAMLWLIFKFLCITISVYLTWTCPAYDGNIEPSDPEYLPAMEKAMAQVIRKYIQVESNQTHLATLRRLAEELEAMPDEHAALKNDPVSMYLAVRSIVEQWASIESVIIGSNSSFDAFDIVAQLPEAEDVEKIATVLFRTQDIYKLDTSEIASGSIKAFRYSSGLTAYDCYDIGMTAFEKSDYYHSLMWLQEAKRRFSDAINETRISESDILFPLAASLERQGNVLHAMEEFRQLKELPSANMSSCENCSDFSSLIADYVDIGFLDRSINFGGIDGEASLPSINNTRLDTEEYDTQSVYEALCRGEVQEAFISTRLSCFYKRTPDSLILAPLKVEIKSQNPSVLLYRSIISDDEIKILQMIFGGLKERLSDRESVNPDYEYEGRTGATRWLQYNYHPVITSIRSRAMLATGLNLRPTQPFQVLRYGIGNDYAPHYDFTSSKVRDPDAEADAGALNGDDASSTSFDQKDQSNHGDFDQDGSDENNEYGDDGDGGYHNSDDALGEPMATMLFYNDALFWYNLKRSGFGDPGSYHAGCPVLSGIKWISNQLFRANDQMFHRSCGLRKND